MEETVSTPERRVVSQIVIVRKNDVGLGIRMARSVSLMFSLDLIYVCSAKRTFQIDCNIHMLQSVNAINFFKLVHATELGM